jgi:hypothetical protein
VSDPQNEAFACGPLKHKRQGECGGNNRHGEHKGNGAEKHHQGDHHENHYWPADSAFHWPLAKLWLAIRDVNSKRSRSTAFNVEFGGPGERTPVDECPGAILVARKPVEE